MYKIMKPPALLILLALATTLPILGLAAEQVVDTQGHAIFPGGHYYIMPAIFGAAGGGLKLGQTGHSKCPVTVLQDYSEVFKGLPVKFTIKDEGIGPGLIFTDTPLDIEFVVTFKGECNIRSTRWVEITSLFSRPSYMGIGGAEDHPGKFIFEGNFRIRRHGSGYKLVFCPYIDITCYGIGRKDDEEGRHLTVIDESVNEPFQLVFVKDASGGDNAQYSIV